MGAEPHDLLERTPTNIAADQFRAESDLEQLKRLIREGAFDTPDPETVGLEVEGGCFDRGGYPANIGEQIIEDAGRHIPGTHELMQLDWELNIRERLLLGDVFTQLGTDLAAYLADLAKAASVYGARIGMFGIPPTLTADYCILSNMTPSQRYATLNDAVMSSYTDGRLRMRVVGTDVFDRTDTSILVEGALTSTQMHKSVRASEFPAAYNGAQITSCLGLVACAGTPYFSGKYLWDESRIPLFGQALPGRTGFGDRWATSLIDHIAYRVQKFDPLILEKPNKQWLRTLRMRTGSVWDWNRACLFPDHTVTVEQRWKSSGPTWRDIIADAAFATGLLLYGQKLMEEGLAERIPFEIARSNFYAAARHSTGASIRWPDGRNNVTEWAGRDLVLELLPQLASTLIGQGASSTDVNTQLGVIEQRMDTHTASAWLRHAVLAHGPQRATQSYLDNSEGGQGKPVGTWEPVR